MVTTAIEAMEIIRPFQLGKIPEALQGISLNFKKDDLVAVVGLSGTCKSKNTNNDGSHEVRLNEILA